MHTVGQSPHHTPMFYMQYLGCNNYFQVFLVLCGFLRSFCLCINIFFPFNYAVSFALQLNDCIEFKVIPPEQYDRNTSSADDINKRPLGYMFATAKYPGVQSGGNLKNPCAYLKNLTSRAVEVMVSLKGEALNMFKTEHNTLLHILRFFTSQQILILNKSYEFLQFSQFLQFS